MNSFLTKVHRYSGYCLFFIVGLFLFSGFAHTKGIISRDIASWLHKDVLPPLGIICFVIHASISARRLLTRCGVRDSRWQNIYIAVFGLALFGFFLYLFLK